VLSHRAILLEQTGSGRHVGAMLGRFTPRGGSPRDGVFDIIAVASPPRDAVKLPPRIGVAQGGALLTEGFANASNVRENKRLRSAATNEAIENDWFEE
jgi:hypothetical protein